MSNSVYKAAKERANDPSEEILILDMLLQGAQKLDDSPLTGIVSSLPLEDSSVDKQS